MYFKTVAVRITQYISASTMIQVYLQILHSCTSTHAYSKLNAVVKRCALSIHMAASWDVCGETAYKARFAIFNKGLFLSNRLWCTTWCDSRGMESTLTVCTGTVCLVRLSCQVTCIAMKKNNKYIPACLYFEPALISSPTSFSLAMNSRLSKLHACLMFLKSDSSKFWGDWLLCPFISCWCCFVGALRSENIQRHCGIADCIH